MKIFYVLSFLGGFSFNVIAPLFVVFGLSLGFSIAQVGVLFGAHRLSVFLFEVPTGFVADSYGRKRSILLAYFLTIFSALIYFFSSNFYVLLFGSMISGLALTFFSGAFEALSVDSLEISNKEQLRNKLFVRLGIASTLGFIIGGFAGSGVAYFDLRYIWLLQAITAIIALISCWLLLKENFFLQEKIPETKGLFNNFFSKTKSSLFVVLQKKRLSVIFIVSILLSLASAFYLISWPVIFKDVLSIPVYYFGIISSVAGAFSMLGSFVAEKITVKRKTVGTVIFFLALTGISFIVFALSKNIVLSLLVFVLIDFLNGGFNPLLYSLLNKFIPSPQRATILSFYSLTEEGSAGVGEVMAGGLLVLIAPPLVVLFSPVLVLAALILFVIKLRESD